jgi:hypothetical protein
LLSAILCSIYKPYHSHVNIGKNLVSSDPDTQWGCWNTSPSEKEILARGPGFDPSTKKEKTKKKKRKRKRDTVLPLIPLNGTKYI